MMQKIFRYVWLLAFLFLSTACPQNKNTEENLPDGFFKVKVSLGSELNTLGVPSDLEGGTVIETAILRVFNNILEELLFDVGGLPDPANGTRRDLASQSTTLSLSAGTYTFQLLAEDIDNNQLAFAEAIVDINGDVEVLLHPDSLVETTSLNGPFNAEPNEVVDVFFYAYPPGHGDPYNDLYVPEEDYPMPQYQVLEGATDVTAEREVEKSKIGVRVRMACSALRIDAGFSDPVLTSITSPAPAAPIGGSPWGKTMGSASNSTYDIDLNGNCTGGSGGVGADLVPPFVSMRTPTISGNNILITGKTGDGQTGMDKVEIYDGTVYIGEADITPVENDNDEWSFTWENVPTGNYNLIAIAYDNAGSSRRAEDSVSHTEATVSLLKDINPTGTSFLNNLTNVNGTLFFRANDGTNGTELWKSDGTSAGTVMIKNINPTDSSSPQDLTNVNETLFFAANNGTNGVELWKSNGTEIGTDIVQDINTGNSGADSSSPSNLTNVNGALFFAADDGSSGRELWVYK